MALSVSIGGGDRVPAKDVVLYDGGVPIAAAMEHGNIVIFADAVRDYDDLLTILNNIGVKIAPARKDNVTLVGDAKGW